MKKKYQRWAGLIVALLFIAAFHGCAASKEDSDDDSSAEPVGDTGDASESGDDGDNSGTAEIVINEVSASNNAIIADEDGEYPDWIELYNKGDGRANLKGLILADESAEWTLPEISLGAGDTVLIFASDKDQVTQSASAIYYHANFRLTAEGEEITLKNSDGTLLDSVTFPSMPTDISWGRYPDGANQWALLNPPTPSESNDSSSPSVDEDSIVINEIMPANASIQEDDTGEYPDWIELYNTSDETVNLEGYSITDGNARKWELPDIDLAPYEFLLIYASGKDTVDISQSPPILHSNFRISAAGEFLSLLNESGGIIDIVNMGSVPVDISIGRTADGGEEWMLFQESTPGAANTGGTAIQLAESIVLNEVMASNASTLKVPDTSILEEGDDEYPDWIELYNNSDATIDLNGYTISGGSASWTFPAVELKSGAFFVIFASGKDLKSTDNATLTLHTSFKVSANGETLTIRDSNGTILDMLETGEMDTDISLGRKPDGTGEWLFFTSPTPGEANTTQGIESIDEE